MIIESIIFDGTFLAMSILAFIGANQLDRPLHRGIGIGALTAFGVMYTFGAASSGNLITWSLGIGMLAVASYAYWSNR